MTGPLPQVPGYYWAKWQVAADGTVDGSDLTPALCWEIVQVNINAPNWQDLSDEQDMERLLVFVPGVQKAQWRLNFLWGDFIAPLCEPNMPVVAYSNYLDRAR